MTKTGQREKEIGGPVTGERSHKMTLSIKGVICVRATARALQLLNGITAFVSAVILYGIVGRSDYTTIYHIAITPEEEHALFIKGLICFIIMLATTAMTVFCTCAVAWLDECIRYRRAKERRRKIRMICNDNRMNLNISIR